MADWTAVDGLIRELGAVRLAARQTIETGAIEAAVGEHIERAIRHAAEAVDRTIDSPNDDEVVIKAWETILVARQVIRSLRETEQRSRELAISSVELRRQAASLMVQSLSIKRP